MSKEKSKSDVDKIFSGFSKTRNNLAVIDELLLYWNLADTDRVLDELEILQVLDGTTGLNMLPQAREFNDVEKLIKELPSVPSNCWSNGDVNLAERNSMSNGISMQHVENGTSVRETQSMLLERIASEMNRLKFYVTHAKVRSLAGESTGHIRVVLLSIHFTKKLS
ncbi:hypothetical protein K1719_003850 [Acacia pycnantha]|nr:hypothetical protein K1719_003850 [Acacia pycnantha]